MKVIKILLVSLLCMMLTSCELLLIISLAVSDQNHGVEMNGQILVDKEELKADENITVNYKLKFSAEDKINSVLFYMFLEKIDDNYEVIDEPCKLNVISRNGNAINIDDDSYSVEDSIFEYKIKKDFSIAGVDETFVVSISEPGMYELTLGAEASSSDESLLGNSMEQFHIIKLEE